MCVCIFKTHERLSLRRQERTTVYIYSFVPAGEFCACTAITTLYNSFVDGAVRVYMYTNGHEIRGSTVERFCDSFALWLTMNRNDALTTQKRFISPDLACTYNKVYTHRARIPTFYPCIIYDYVVVRRKTNAYAITARIFSSSSSLCVYSKGAKQDDEVT